MRTQRVLIFLLVLLAALVWPLGVVLPASPSVSDNSLLVLPVSTDFAPTNEPAVPAAGANLGPCTTTSSEPCLAVGFIPWSSLDPTEVVCEEQWIGTELMYRSPHCANIEFFTPGQPFDASGRVDVSTAILWDGVSPMLGGVLYKVLDENVLEGFYYTCSEGSSSRLDEFGNLIVEEVTCPSR